MAKDTPKEPVDKTVPDTKSPPDNKATPDNQPKQPNAPLPDIAAKDTVKPVAQQSKTADTVVPFDKISDIVPEKKAEPKKPELSGQDKKESVGSKKVETKQDKPPNPEKESKAPKAPKPKNPIKQVVTAKEEAPKPEPILPLEPKEPPRKDEQEQIVYLNFSKLHAFKNHPFGVRDDEEMRAMVESVKDKGVTQPAIVRPREGGGYEIVSGHRRQKASELAGYGEIPCIIRNLTDEQAITQMVEDNTNQRESILPSERSAALKMQLDAIKHQGTRTSSQFGPKEVGQRSNQIVAERNKMTVKQVQRYIRLNELVPDMLKMVDEKRIAFTPAVEMSYIKPKNQRYIAVAIEGQQSSPSLSQAQRMRELDQKGLLNGDMIDGIMLEEKKEVDKVILSGQELGQYFGKDKTPREMKDQIIKLLDEWKGQQKDIAKPEKKTEQEK